MVPRGIALALALGLLAAGGTARAQTPEELAAGRRLFAEALADEDAKRYGDALDKYQRVQQIKDTSAVRFRIGATLEALRKPTRAQEAYAGALELAETESADADIAREAKARIAALDALVAHLTLEVPRARHPDVRVAVDDEPVTDETDVRLDPGPHVVTASAAGMRPFRARLTLSDGAHVEVPIVFEQEGSSSLVTVGVVTGIVGALLIAGGVVSFIVRSNAISELEESCPNGLCPIARESDLRAAHDRAELTGPLGTALVVSGIVGLGTGVALFAVGSSSARATPTPGGAMLTLGASF